MPASAPTPEVRRAPSWMLDEVIAYLHSTPMAMMPAYAESLVSLLDDAAGGNGMLAARKRKEGATRAKTVGVLGLMGPLFPRANILVDLGIGTALDEWRQWLRVAVDDPAYDSIVIDVDSPGGSVHGVRQTFDAVAAAAKKKKVTAVVNSLAASAAYWIASAATEIVVAPGGEVGSIGVYLMHTDRSRAANAAGLKVTYIKAGKHKVSGNPYEPLSHEAATHLQRGVDGHYAMFVQDVARGRKTTQTAVRGGFGQGGMVISSRAVGEDMADWVGSLDEVLAGAVGSGSRGTSAAVQERRRMLATEQRSATRSTPTRPAPSPITPALRLTAFHEAGHAVVAVALGAPVRSVSIIPQPGGSEGHVDCDLSRLYFLERAAVYYAGVLAEHHADLPGRGWYSGSADDEFAAQACPEGLRADARRKAAKLVAEHWLAIQAVADMLLAKRMIAGADVANAMHCV